MCCKSIDITAKSGNNSAVISVRENELISNLRVLIAVRFEQAINIVVLVFGGQVLRDVGTIDSHGIISGVTVYVIFRELTKSSPAANAMPNRSSSPAGLWTSRNSRVWLKSSDLFKPLLDDPDTLRDMLQSDTRIKSMIEEHASLRHFLNSDRNLRELFSTVFNPAKVQELGRKRDMNIMRMEWIPGGYSILDKLNYFMRQAHEDNVAMTYQDLTKYNDNRGTDNPQRGRENKMPLPNPWRKTNLVSPKARAAFNAERFVSDLSKKCDHMMKSLGDINKTLEHVKQLNEMAVNARRQLHQRIRERLRVHYSSAQPNAKSATNSNGSTTSAATVATGRSNISSLNLFDFMSSNDRRWEQHFRPQLLQLTNLGHTDRERNICALVMSAGDIQTAVKLLEQWNR